MKRIGRGLAVLAMAGVLTGLGLAGAIAKERRVTFRIENMTCASCPFIVKKAMEGVEGVKTVSVSFEKKEAVVVYDDARTTPAAIARASTEHGYPATPLRKETPADRR
ncbi:MAG: mercuric transport protein periplasmic component [Alphaproteobacteria bacterium]|nr:MAG: mercuric transport protein periplasmic component [Alphaproteobacteria bacterium]